MSSTSLEHRKVLVALEHYGARGASTFKVADRLGASSSWVLDQLRRLERDNHVVQVANRGWMLKSHWCPRVGDRLEPISPFREVDIPTTKP